MSRVFTATSTAPASGTAKCAMSISGRFGIRYATRSPGPAPLARSAPATRCASAASSRVREPPRAVDRQRSCRAIPAPTAPGTTAATTPCTKPGSTPTSRADTDRVLNASSSLTPMHHLPARREMDPPGVLSDRDLRPSPGADASAPTEAGLWTARGLVQSEFQADVAELLLRGSSVWPHRTTCRI